jgi:hypothetical protein
MSASVRMICPNLLCRAVLAAPAAARGKKVRCRSCGMRVQVPAIGGKPSGDAKSKADKAA